MNNMDTLRTLIEEQFEIRAARYMRKVYITGIGNRGYYYLFDGDRLVDSITYRYHNQGVQLDPEIRNDFDNFKHNFIVTADKDRWNELMNFIDEWVMKK